MQNVNDYAFAKQLDLYKAKEIDVLKKNTEDAAKIIGDPNYPWKTPEAKEAGMTRFAQMKSRLAILEKFHEEGMTLVKQHEALVNTMSKVYDNWYQNISNEGKQETELMSSQADILCELMGDIYKELLPLNLPGMKPPKGMNLK